MTKQTIRCSECGGDMVRDTRQMTFSYKGMTATVDQAGYYCTQCDESVHTGVEAAAADRALNLMKAKIQGLLLPNEIRRIRHKLRLSQEAAGLIIGGGKNAFTRYERGDILPSRAISNLLHLMDKQPEQLEILTALRRPTDSDQTDTSDLPRKQDNVPRQRKTEVGAMS